MPKNIVIDLNVILDVLLKRQGYEASRSVLELHQSPSCNLYISAHAVTTFAYLLEHANVPRVEVLRQINWLLGTFSVISTTNDILKAATQSRITDYEDAVVEQAAIACKASMIITRNIKDYKNSAIKAIKPESYNY
ncbi:MAG: PIN domain-containing protein [Candidatus Saccharimonadales bacterium]